MDLGQLREWSEGCLREGLDRVIALKNKRLTPYYVLVIAKSGYHGQPAGNAGKNTQTVDLSKKKVIHVTLVIMDAPPVTKLIGTSLFRIDNKTGEVRMIYILPQDKPMVGEFEVGHVSERIDRSAKNMPIIYD